MKSVVERDPREALEQVIRRRLRSLPDERLAEIATDIERLVAVLRQERIYAFGSHARGTGTALSDVDLLVIVPDSDLPPPPA